MKKEEIEQLKKENEELKTIIRRLRDQLYAQKKKVRRKFDDEQDFVPYHEKEDIA